MGTKQKIIDTVNMGNSLGVKWGINAFIPYKQWTGLALLLGSGILFLMDYNIYAFLCILTWHLHVLANNVWWKLVIIEKFLEKNSKNSENLEENEQNE